MKAFIRAFRDRSPAELPPKAIDQTTGSNGGTKNGIPKLIRSSTTSSSISGFSTLPDPAAKGQKEVTVDLRSSIQEEVTPNGSHKGRPNGTPSGINGHSINGIPQIYIKQSEASQSRNSSNVTQPTKNGQKLGTLMKKNRKSYTMAGDADGVEGNSKSKSGNLKETLPHTSAVSDANGLHIQTKDSTSGKITSGDGLSGGDRSNGEASNDSGLMSRMNGSARKTLGSSGIGLEKVSEQQEIILSAPDEFRDSNSGVEPRSGKSAAKGQSAYSGNYLTPMGKYEIKSSSFAYLPTVDTPVSLSPVPDQPIEIRSTAASDDGALQGHSREDESTIYEKISESSRGIAVKGLLDVDNTSSTLASLNGIGSSHRQTSDLTSFTDLPSSKLLSVSRESVEDRRDAIRSNVLGITGKPEVSKKKPYSALRDKQFKGRLESIIAQSSATPSVASAMSSISRRGNDDTSTRVNRGTGVDPTSEVQRAQLEPAKKYRFLVHGIDIPKELEEEEEETPNGKGDDLDGEKRAERERKGFSYILDRRLAEEITKRASDVTARKPHEAVERGKASYARTPETEDDAILQEARIKLLQPRVEAGDVREKREESKMLMEIREQLKKRRRFEESSSSDEEEPDLMNSAGGDGLGLPQTHRPTEQQVHRHDARQIDQTPVINIISSNETGGILLENKIDGQKVVTKHAVSRTGGKDVGTMILIDQIDGRDTSGVLEPFSSQSPQRQNASTNTLPQATISTRDKYVSTTLGDRATTDSTPASTPTKGSPRNPGVIISITDTSRTMGDEDRDYPPSTNAFRTTAADVDDTRREYYASIHPYDAKDAAAVAETGERRGSIDRRGRSFAVTRNKSRPIDDFSGQLEHRPNEYGLTARPVDDGLPPRPPDYNMLHKPPGQTDTSGGLRIDRVLGEVTEAGVRGGETAVAISSSGSDHPHHMKRPYSEYPGRWSEPQQQPHAAPTSSRLPGYTRGDAYRRVTPEFRRPRGAGARRGSSDEPSSHESFSSTSGFTDSSRATVTRRFERRENDGGRQTRSRSRGTVYGRILHDATDSDDRTQVKRPRPRSRSRSLSRGGDITVITATSNDRLTTDHVTSKPEPLVYGYITPNQDFGVTDLESHDYKQRTLRSKLRRLRRPVATVRVTDSEADIGGAGFSEPEHDLSGHLVPLRVQIPSVQFRVPDSQSQHMRGLAPNFAADPVMRRVNAIRDVYGQSALGVSSLEVTEVNPRLHDVGKRGNVYQVAMKLNAVHSSRSTSVSNSLNQYSSITDLTQQHQQQQNGAGNLIYQHAGLISADAQSPGFRNRPGNGGLNRPGSAGSLVVRLPISPQHQDQVDGDSSYRSRSGLAGEESYAIKSVRSSFRRTRDNDERAAIKRSGVVNDSPRSESVDFKLELRTVTDGMSRTNEPSIEQRRNEQSGLGRVGDGVGVPPLYTMTINDTMTVAYKPGEVGTAQMDVPDGFVGAMEAPVVTHRGTNTDRPPQIPARASRYDNETMSTNQHRRHKRHQQQLQHQQHQSQQQQASHRIRRRQIDSTDAYNGSSALRARPQAPNRPPSAGRVAMATRRGPLRRSDGDDDDDDDEEEEEEDPAAAVAEEDDLRRYLSPAETDDEETGRIRANPADFPKVVRGSILIRNSIDTTGGPRHLDVVAGDDPDGGGFVVEDNTNMFHRRYFQSRENPLYLSDPEYEEVVEQVSPGQRRKRPPFAEVFHESESSQRRKKSPQRQRTRNDRGDSDGFDREVQINRGMDPISADLISLTGVLASPNM